MTLPPALARPFRIIAFDWDGTAVANRSVDGTPVRRCIERLAHSGVPIVVVTGTKLANVDPQLSAAIRGPHKRRLYLATNRGSEVYGFDDQLRPVLVDVRRATSEEDRLLTRVADSVREELAARTGLDFRVVHDRMNRRKIDLIPVPEWEDPPKSALGDVLGAVEARLRGAGLSGGLHAVLELTEDAVRRLGLRDARITSDVKHVEVGLTDKGDSIRWLLRALAKPAGIRVEDVLIVGDEFGPVAGLPGSDAKMMIPEAREATFVSVGPEPGGAQQGVLHLPGGPERFLSLLSAQAASHPVELSASPTADDSWRLVEEGFSLLREHEVESIFAFGNGYFGSRASLSEGSTMSTPATFLAGVFEPTAGAGAGPALASLPDWSALAAKANGEPLSAEKGENLEHRRVLDLRNALLWREWRHRDPAGRVTLIRGFRLASVAQRHLLVQSILLTPENYGGRIVVDTLALEDALWRTASGTSIALTSSAILETPDTLQILDGGTGRQPALALSIEMGKSYRLDRVVSVSTSRDATDPLAAARHALDELLTSEWPEGAIAAHRRGWQKLWSAADLHLDGDPETQRALRFAIYHLLSAANPDDERASIGARALTGSVYQGHVFWDTDVFMLPFFTLTVPATARALCKYRFNTLPAARAKAAKQGYRGALYAWESADTGEEVTPPFAVGPDGLVIQIRSGIEEHHISADVAYGVWQYWLWTGDETFLFDAGAEILLETARFWASRASPGDDGRYHIRGVVGPDEYHESVDDDAFTNGMAQWNLEKGAEIARLLERRAQDFWERLCRRIGLGQDELREWERVASKMYTGLDPETGIIEQFKGYRNLELVDLSKFEHRSLNMDVLLGRKRIEKTQVIKQADVVMLIHLLWDRFPSEVRERNFRFYEPRTDHGSSLSPPVHALVAARLGDLALAEQYFRRTMEIDLASNVGNAAGGVHAAALGGLWQAAVFGFAGLELGPDGPVLKPRLPTGWRAMKLDVIWRGRRHRLDTAYRRRPRDAVGEEVSS